MKKIILWVIGAFLLVPALTTAQEKELTVSDCILNRSIRPSYLKNLEWRKTDCFTYTKNNKLVQGKVGSSINNRDTILGIKEITDALSKLNDSLTISYFPRITWINANKFRFLYKNTYYIYDFNNKTVEKLLSYSKDAGGIDYHTETNNLAYTKGNNLFVSVNGKELAISNEKNEDILFGQAVHQREFGIHKGTFWSNGGDKLAFYRMNQSMVSDYPIVDISKRVAENENIKYPMAGMSSHEVSLGIYNIKTQKNIYLDIEGPKEQYLTNIAWGSKDMYIYVAIVNRDQNKMQYNQYSAVNGSFIKTLFIEEDEKYTEPEKPAYFLNKKSQQFLWLSERDGFNHIYLYDINGKMVKQLTKGDWIVTKIIGINKTDEYVYFTASKESPIENHTYSVNIKTGKILRLDSEPGWHSPLFNEDYTYFIDIYSSLSVPKKYDLYNSSGKNIDVIYSSENPIKDYKIGETTIFTIKAEDNTDLYCRMIKPVNFDSSKKYPVFYYVYGGPHVQLIKNRWLGGSNLFMQYMASKGYVVFTLDNRGSSNRGRDFEQAIFRNVGDVEAKDQLKGVEYLKKQSYIDTNKLALQGWSYGGFLTTTLMLKYPDVFKVAVAGGPVTDWKYYEIMYGERYMDSPQNNPEGYKKSSLLNYVENLKGRLMLIHGAVDPVVLWQHSLALIEESVKKGVQIDYFVYPGHKHNVRGKDRVHLLKRIERYFEDYLN